MFGLFPFGMGNMVSFTSITSFTNTGNGINGFNITNGYNGFYDPDQLDYYIPNINNLNYSNLNGTNLLDQIQNAVTKVLSNENVQELAGQYCKMIANAIEQTKMNNNNITINSDINSDINNNNCDFIRLERNNDMYILKIDMKGIDLRELSIRYDPGILDINLKRSEYDNNSYNYGGYTKNIVKRDYNTCFNNIDEIDTDRVIKSIDNGILVMRMPKKYALDSSSKIVEVESYTVDEEDKKVIPRM